MPTGTTRAGVIRGGLLVVPLLLGAVLVGTAAAGLSAAEQVGPVLARGQSETYLRALRESMRPPFHPDQQALQRVLDRYHAEGLRYIAVLDTGGVTAMAVGDSGLGNWPLPKPHELQRGAGRIRVLTPPPPPAPPPPLPPGWSQEDAADWPPPYPPPPAVALSGIPAPGPTPGQAQPPVENTVVMEFVPVPAQRLLSRARTTMAFSAAAAVLLMAASALLWRQLAKEQAAEAKWETQRHLARLGEMTAVLAHEIRNPLAVAKGHAQLLREKVPASDPASDQVDQVVEHLVRLEVLTGHLLDFARSEQVQRQDVRPAEILRDAAISLEPQRISLDVDDAPEQWSLDPVRIRQVFVNLLQNALQSSAGEATVDVRMWQGGATLELSVRDRGPGIEPGEEEKIFEPFHTKRVRGTGLGLAVARRIVEAHGGSIRAERPGGGGALFRVSIPRM